MRYDPSRIPADVRPLVERFRSGLIAALGSNLVGAYLMGSIAFARGSRHVGDVDFHVFVRRPLSPQEKRDLGRLHRDLALGHRLGDELDGLYLLRSKARRRGRPAGVGFGEDGRARSDVRDDMWALHRAHVHGGASVALIGPAPTAIYPTVAWPEIARALREEFSRLRKGLDRYPAYTTLQLCRLMYTWRTRKPVVSKRGAAAWALRTLPTAWRTHVRTALHAYSARESGREIPALRRSMVAFYGFAEEQIAEARSVRPTRLRA
jgi:hypothetical protein